MKYLHASKADKPNLSIPVTLSIHTLLIQHLNLSGPVSPLVPPQSNRDFKVELADQIPGRGSYREKTTTTTTLSALNVFHIKHKLQITGHIWALHLIWSQHISRQKENSLTWCRKILIWEAQCVLSVITHKKLFLYLKNVNTWTL